MENLVRNILKGDDKSLEELIVQVQKRIYNLSLKFLWSKEDSEDATQEILMKIISNLARFEFKSNFSTWIYRIAVNYLLNLKKSKLEKQLNFYLFGDDLANGLDFPSYDLPDKNLLVEEVKIGCTLGMLLCLDRNLRIAYILGEVFELNSNDASEILSIRPENFRKRLSQARKILQTFMKAHCGLVSTTNVCRCNKRINYALETGRVKRDNLSFVSPALLGEAKNEMERLYSTTAIFKSQPWAEMNEIRSAEILNVLSGVKYIF